MERENRFVKKHVDLSNNQGFQFEFQCDRCGEGYLSSFKSSDINAVSEVLNTTSSIFGGFFDSTVHLKQDLQYATLEKAHNKAFEEAEAEMKSHFLQCPKCSRFLCNKCWDSEKNLCHECQQSVDAIK